MVPLWFRFWGWSSLSSQHSLTFNSGKASARSASPSFQPQHHFYRLNFCLSYSWQKRCIFLVPEKATKAAVMPSPDDERDLFVPGLLQSEPHKIRGFQYGAHRCQGAYQYHSLCPTKYFLKVGQVRQGSWQAGLLLGYWRFDWLYKLKRCFSGNYCCSISIVMFSLV